MGKLDDLLKLASDGSLDDQRLLDEMFAEDLVDLFNWMPAYDTLRRMRGQAFADSMLFNLATKHTIIALDCEGEELSRQLQGIRSILNNHDAVNFAFTRWLIAEEGRRVLETLHERMNPGESAPTSGDEPN
jgi:hypothetical protein